MPKFAFLRLNHRLPWPPKPPPNQLMPPVTVERSILDFDFTSTSSSVQVSCKIALNIFFKCRRNERGKGREKERKIVVGDLVEPVECVKQKILFSFSYAKKKFLSAIDVNFSLFHPDKLPCRKKAWDPSACNSFSRNLFRRPTCFLFRSLHAHAGRWSAR
jgi:hypothetical protein